MILIINIAFYIRLSKEIDKEKESESVSNQRDLLNKYAKDNFSKYKVLEFIDDGFSGTSFDRPAFKRLIKEVEDNKIDIILLKDLSRLGRNYIDSMHYIEQVFPVFKVQLIAVNDNFNSMVNNTSSIETSFKTLINSYYSKDLSKKIKVSYNNKASKGKCLSSPFYGYKKSKTEKNKLEVDKEASIIVKNIFKMFLDGMDIKSIARKLNDDNVLTPMEYIVENNLIKRNVWRNKSEVVFWNYHHIWKILKNERYTGKFIYNRYEVKEVGANKTRQTSKDNWNYVEDAIPKIITDEDFKMVNKKIKKIKTVTNKVSDDVFLNKIVCGKCNRNLLKHKYTYKGVTKIKYNCKFYKNTSYNLCFDGFIYRNEIEEIIVKNVKLQIQVYTNLQEKEKLKNEEYKRQLKIVLETEDTFISKGKRLKVNKSELIEKLLANKISEEEYKILSLNLEKKIKVTDNKLNDLFIKKEKLKRQIQEKTAKNILDLLEESLNCGKGIETIVAFVDKVVVYEKDRIEVLFNFEDGF